jgi:hypothetical protein
MRFLRGTATGLAAALATGLLAVGLTAVAPAAPVSAHSGGKAVVLVADLTLAPTGNSWTASTTLFDGGSGSPIRGADVKALLGTPAKTVSFAQGSSLGLYTASLGALPAGPTHLELKVRTLPGSEPVVPYDNAWDFTLTAGQPMQVASETAGGGGSNVALILSVAGAVILLAVLYGLFSLRRRTSAPAPPR